MIIQRWTCGNDTVLISKWCLDWLINTEVVCFCSQAYPGKIILTLWGSKMRRWRGSYWFGFEVSPTSLPPGSGSSQWMEINAMSCEGWPRGAASQWECCCKSDRSPAAAPAKVTRDKPPPLQSPAISPSPLLLHPTHTPPASLQFCCADKDRASRWAGDREHLNNISQVDAAKENLYFDQCFLVSRSPIEVILKEIDS